MGTVCTHIRIYTYISQRWVWSLLYHRHGCGPYYTTDTCVVHTISQTWVCPYYTTDMGVVPTIPQTRVWSILYHRHGCVHTISQTWVCPYYTTDMGVVPTHRDRRRLTRSVWPFSAAKVMGHSLLLGKGELTEQP